MADQRFIIFGAGAIGGVTGAHLALAGKEVIFIGRQNHVDAINNNGLKLITPVGTKKVSVHAVTGPDQIAFKPEDVVILSVKGQDTEKALQDLKRQTTDVPLLCFQNGVRNEETASKYFPRVYGVMVSIGAVYMNHGEVLAKNDPPGALVIGRYPNGQDAFLEQTAQSLRAAGFVVKVSADVMSYKWGKLMLNLGNAIQAITNTWGEEDNKIAKAGWQEARALLAEAKIKWISPRDLEQEWPEGTAEPKSKIEHEAKNSTWMSLATKHGVVETDYLNGEITRVAAQLGKKAPVAEGLQRVIQDMAARKEVPGRYTASELSHMIGLS